MFDPLSRPRIIIVAGRPGSGKTTLSRKLGDALFMPIISRDVIKEGFVHTFRVAHDDLPADTNGRVSGIFFDLIDAYLSSEVSIIAEAAFQHQVWAGNMARIQSAAHPVLIECVVEPAIAAARHLERGLGDQHREWFHGDRRVRHFRQTGKTLPPEPFESPQLGVPSLRYAVDSGVEGFQALLDWIRSEV